jgi:hypothetical protein
VDPGPGLSGAPVRVSRFIWSIHLSVTTATERGARLGPIPQNVILRHVRIFHNSTAGGEAQWQADILIADGDTGSELGGPPTGTSIFRMKKAELAGPGWTQPEYPIFAVINQPLEFFPDLAILGEGKFLKWHVDKSSAGAFTGTLVATFDQYDRPPFVDPGAIVPRGTELSPVCVRICPPEGGPPVAPPPGPPPPPPPGPPPGPAASFNPTERPLPIACTIDPVQPLNVTLQVCQVP